MSSPPRLARALLALAAPRRERSEVVSELDIAYRRRVTDSGAAAARRWYRSQVARSVLPLLGRRLRRHPFSPLGTDGMFQDLRSDLRFALRSLLRRPLFATVVVVILGLAIAATATVFTLYRSVLLRPLPYPEPGELVYVFGSNPSRNFVSIAPLDFVDYRRRTRAFDAFAAFQPGPGEWDLTGHGEPRRLGISGVSHEFFTALGVRMAVGRGFLPEDEGEEPEVVVLTHGTWQRLFEGDPEIVGERVVLDGLPRTVVGVTPAGFRWFGEPDGFYPFPFDAPGAQTREYHFLRGIARLADGVDPAVAQSDLDAIAADLGESYPATNEGWGVSLVPLHEVIAGPSRTALVLLLVAVGAVLLIACSNIATMMLTRATRRGPEIAVRAALGASSRRVARLVLVEALALSGAGGLLGFALAAQAVSALRVADLTGLPTLLEIRMDPVVLATTAAIAALSGLLFSVVPALRLARRDAADLLRGQRGVAAGGSRTRRALLVAQVALSAALLLSAVLLLRSFWELRTEDPGFSTEGVLTARVSLPDARYPDGEAVSGFFERLDDGLRALPGVVEAGAVSMLPLTGGNDLWTTRTDVPDDDPRWGAAPQSRIVLGDYFDTVDIELLAGRRFAPTDGPDSPPVAIVDEQFAAALFGDEDPLGKVLRMYLQPRLEVEVVGVVRAIQHFSLGRPLYPGGTIYRPHAQAPVAGMTLALRSRDPTTATAALRRLLAEIDPMLPLSDLRGLETLVQGSVAGPRFRAALVGGFAVAALCLAAIGLYGAMSFWVAGRRRELGVRFALGADGRTIARLVLRRGLGVLLIGVVAGTGAAVAAGRALSSLLHGVSATDPLSILLVAVGLLAVGMAACFLPARRATRMDPVEALRPD